MIERRSVLVGASAIVMSALAGTTVRAESADGPVAQTQHGKVRGASSGDIKIFKGIPYGASTGGANRFKAPQPPAPWTDLRDALAFVPMSPQVIYAAPSIFSSWTFEKAMSEDCLGINVWTPGVADGKKRPVMVWFHGGDFSSLSGSRNVFDGTHLAQKGDVVVVTLNHRLNLFGYLDLAQLAPSLDAAPNPGLLDLIAALRWVRDNIAEFGGDPGNVTIFGQSGGGGKVSCLMAMPAAAGLFHRAIVQSGSYYLKAMNGEEGTALARQLLTALDLAPGDAGKLATLPMETLVAGLAKSRISFRPAIDGHDLPSGPWSPNGPAVSRDVPMMIGTVATEMTLLTGARDPSAFTLEEPALKGRLEKWFKPGDIDKVIAAFRTTWPGGTPSDLFFAIDTDKFLRDGAWQQAERKVAQHGGPIWLYEVDWKTPVDGGKWRTPHSVELAFVFDNVGVSASIVGTGPEAQAMADQMSATWLAFARSGNPNNKAIPDWPAYEPGGATMVFDNPSKAVTDYRGAERRIMTELG